jgi:hypothetical protein
VAVGVPASLALEDGLVLRGRSCGAPGECSGELCFNTSMSGYQEVLTDPSYAGQIVTMTMPHIGNYGVNGADMESRGIFAKGFVVRMCDSPQLACRAALPTLLEGRHRRIEGWTPHRRHPGGAMRAVISTSIGTRHPSSQRRNDQVSSGAIRSQVAVAAYRWGAGTRR